MSSEGWQYRNMKHIKDRVDLDWVGREVKDYFFKEGTCEIKSKRHAEVN